MKSIFFISLMNGSPWGGSEELWYRTALYASQRGLNIGCAIYHWQQKEEKIQKLVDGGCKVFWMPNKGRSKKNLRQKIQYKFTKTKIKKHLHALPIKEYDMVVINQGGFEPCKNKETAKLDEGCHYKFICSKTYTECIGRKIKYDYSQCRIIIQSDHIRKAC